MIGNNNKVSGRSSTAGGTRRKEIPSSLDLRPLGVRIGNKQSSGKVKSNGRYDHVKSVVDHGKRESKTVMAAADTQKVVRMRGENFGRIAPATLA